MRIKRQSDDVLSDAVNANDAGDKPGAHQAADDSLVREGEDLTPRKIIDHYRGLLDRGELGRSRSGITALVQEDLAAYYERRGWGEPTDEQVAELVREIL